MKRRRRGKRIQAGLQDGKTFALYRAACGLLASNDFEDISVARIAKAGGCSVGAFYGRFLNKRAFLDFVIRETFRQAEKRAENALNENAVKKISVEKSSQRIAEYFSAKFSDAEFSGVIRAAIKLGFSDPKSCTPFDDYRMTVTERVIEILAPQLRRGGESDVREAMQAVIGILADAVISESVHMEPGTRRMNEALSGIIIEIACRNGKAAPKFNKLRRLSKDKGENLDIGEPKLSPKKPRPRKISVI